MHCYLCNSSDVIKIHKGTRDDPLIDVYKCSQCSLKFLSSGIKNDVLYYENGEMHATTSQSLSIEERIKRFERDDIRKAQMVSKYIMGKDVLDFGCGYGGVLERIRKSCKSVSGVELEKGARDWLRFKGIEVVKNIYELNKKFDVITLFHVFEHLSEPEKWLKILKKFLKEDGIIFLEIPNANDALLELYECQKFADFTYWSPHVFLYNEETIRLLAEKNEFEILNIENVQRYSLGNHLYWLSKGKPGGDQIWDFFNDEVLNELYKDKLSKLGMTDTILVVMKPICVGEKKVLENYEG